MASMTCGKCKETHLTVEAVRRCYDGTAHPCGWLSEARDAYGILRDEDGGVIILECKAAAWDNGRATVCEDGHEYVPAEVRFREGWDYYDEEEAAAHHAFA